MPKKKLGKFVAHSFGQFFEVNTILDGKVQINDVQHPTACYDESFSLNNAIGTQ